MSHVANSISAGVLRGLMLGSINIYTKQDGISVEDLKTQIKQRVNDIGDEDLASLFEFMQDILKKGGKDKLSKREFVKVLVQFGLDDEHSSVVGEVWEKEREKVFTYQAEFSSVMPTLQNVSWRVDEKIDQSFENGHEAKPHEAMALLELRLKQQGVGETVRFEMSVNQVSDLLAQFEVIQSKMESVADNSS